MEIHVIDYEWNGHYSSPEECVTELLDSGDMREGEEFEMVRLTVGAKTKYRVVDGKPVPIELAFPDPLKTQQAKGE